MEWPNSPSDLNPPGLREDGISLKRKLATDESGSSDENDDLPKAKVTHIVSQPSPSPIADKAQIQRKSNRVLDSDDEAELTSPQSKVQIRKVSSETHSRPIKYSLLFD